MALPFLFVRVTHTGLYADGRPNLSSVLITDCDVGSDLQSRKVPVYIPVGGFKDLDLTSHTLYSFSTGDIAGFVAAGLLTATIILRLRDLGTTLGPPLSVGINNMERVGNTLRFVVDMLDAPGLIVGEELVFSGLTGLFSEFNGVHLTITGVTKDTDLVGLAPGMFLTTIASPGPDIVAATLVGVTSQFPHGRVSLEAAPSNAGGFGFSTSLYVGGDVTIMGAVDPPQVLFTSIPPAAAELGSLFVDDNDQQLFFKDFDGLIQPVSSTISLARTAITWAPTGGGDATTFAEVYTILSEMTHPATIYLSRESILDPPLKVPAGTWELAFGSIVTKTFGDMSLNEMILSDGAVLRNLGSINYSCTLRSLSSSPVFEFDGLAPNSPPVLYLGVGCALVNDGTSPCYIVPDNSFAILAMRGGGTADGLNGQPIFALGSGSFCLLRIEMGSTINPTLITGPADSFIQVNHNGDTKFPISLPGFLGTLQNKPFGTEGGAGPKSFRPDVGDPGDLPSVGCSYYDTDLSLPIWWTGVAWIDATGTPV